MRRRRSSRSAVSRAAAFTIEALEGRQYFITLTGGDEFIFASPDSRPDGAQVHVKLTGNIVAEVVGAFPTQFGDVGLTEIPGLLNGTSVLGGVGGVGGTQLLGTPGAANPITGISEAGIDIVDPGGILGGPATVILFDNEGVDNINFQALASTPAGLMYGINVFEQSLGGATVQRAALVRFDNLPGDTRPGPESVVGTVIADLTPSILSPGGAATFFNGGTINGVTAASFDPISGNLFFVVHGDTIVTFPDGETGTTARPQLYSVNVAPAGNAAITNPGAAATAAAAINASVTAYNLDFGFIQFVNQTQDGSYELQTNEAIVNSITFDQLTPTTARLLASTNLTQVVSGGQTSVVQTINRLTSINIGAGTQQNLGRITYQGDNLLVVTGIEVGVDDPNAAAETLFLTTSETATAEGVGGDGGGGGGGDGADIDPSLLEIDLTQPVGGTLPGLVIGSLPDPSDANDPVRGSDIQGFSYNPTVVDPITGATGAFVGVDATSDELVIISSVRRFANADVFRIHIVSADRDATYSMVVSSIKGARRVFDTFTDTSTVPLQTAVQVAPIPFPADIGRVYIGGRVLAAEPTRWIPFTEAEYAPDETYGQLPREPVITSGLTSAVGVNMGKVLIAGTMTGAVNLGGSIDTYYNGLLLTGAINGANLGTTSRQGNFSVNGDINSLIVKSHIGTISGVTPGDVEQYASGFDGIIQGEVGHFQAHASILGSLVAENIAPGYDAEDQREYEHHANTTTNDVLDVSGLNLLEGLLGSNAPDSAFLWNDTLENPQYLNAIGTDDINGFIRINGTRDSIADATDTYAVSLLAGQTIIVQNVAGRVDVYDPDGRRISSDSAHLNANAGKAFRVTADRPGIYKFVCSTSLIGGTYQLNVRRVGNVAMGGVSAGADIWNLREAESFRVGFGDLGSMFAGASVSFGAADGAIFSYDPINNLAEGQFDFTGRDDIRTQAGHIRAVDAAAIGQTTELLFGHFNIQTDAGNIGLLRARSSFLTVSSAHINGSLQLFDAFATGSMYLAAVRGMGAFRAGDTASPTPSFFRVNIDEQGADGIIGLIDVAGDFGTNPFDVSQGQTPDNFNTNGGDPELPATGGAAIYTGQGGNVRYMHVGGAVYQDEFFGIGEPVGERGSNTTFDVGVAREFTDDGGGTIRVTPVGTTTPNPLFDGTDPTIDPLIGPSLTIITYGVRTGGVVLVDASVSGPNVQGVLIEGGAVGGQGVAVEVGNIAIHEVTGAGTPMTLNADGLPILPGGTVRRRERGPLVIDPITGLAVRNNSAIGTPTVPLTVDITGSSRVDVFSIEGRTTPLFSGPDLTTNPGASGGAVTTVQQTVTIGGNFTRIRNNTGGELVTIKVGDLAELDSRGSIGVGQMYEGVALNPLAVLDNSYPYVQQRTGVVADNIGFVTSSRGIGNLIVSGAINTVGANHDGTDESAYFEGVFGPIVATGGNIGYVQVGEGLSPSGSGSVGFSGIYATGIIQTVTNQGLGSDIRGDIISNTEIRTISLSNGSIINSDIEVAATFENGIDFGSAGGTFPGGPGTTLTRPNYVIDNISVRGRGGIIGSQIIASNIDTINVEDGFGIFATEIIGIAGATVNRVTTDGYGLRYNLIQSGANLNLLSARGNGQLLSTERYSPTVRYSETQPVDEYFSTNFDPFFEFPPNLLTDIHAVLGTSASVPVIPGVTDAGIIENTDSRGFRNLGTASAYQIRTRDINALPVTGIEFPTQFNFSRQIGTIVTRDRIDGLLVTTGRIGRFLPASDVFRMDMNVTGNIRSIRINGSLGDNSEIVASGPSGTLSSVYIAGDLDGDIRASSRIGKVYVGGVTTGNVRVDNLTGVNNINSLTSVGGIGAENLTINGSIGRITIGRGSSLLTPGGTLTINGNLAGISVRGGVLDTNVVVNGNIGTIDVRGTLAGDITATGDVKRISVANAEGANTNSVRGDIDIAGNLGSFTVRGGNVISNVNIGGDLGSFSQTNGSVLPLPGGVTPNTFAVGQLLRRFSTTGNVVANLSAGTFGNVTIRGDLGDGVTPITSTANEWSVLSVFGSILTGSSTNVAGTLGSLVVRGNVEAGAIVAAGAIGRKNIGGAVTGTVTP
ncbi:MAG TPA: hypothetical protein VGN72_11870 [Tepidisphaeraceae bacterium]|jgi:hypothetical protein|nr:hypothetical protein [Tepidisphaeraceae bacterium]